MFPKKYVILLMFALPTLKFLFLASITITAETSWE